MDKLKEYVEVLKGLVDKYSELNSPERYSALFYAISVLENLPSVEEIEKVVYKAFEGYVSDEVRQSIYQDISGEIYNLLTSKLTEGEE